MKPGYYVPPSILLAISFWFMTAGEPGRAAAVDTKAISVNLIPDKPTIMLGEPTYFSFVISNNSARDFWLMEGPGYVNDINDAGRPDDFTVKVVGEGGWQAPQVRKSTWMEGASGPVKLPAKGDYTIRLFLAYWATPSKPGEYTFTAQRVLNLTAAESSFKATTDLSVEATAHFRVIRSNKQDIGKLIDELGKQMQLPENGFKARAQVREAVQMLSMLQDERVIPYFLIFLRPDDYEHMSGAILALSRFNNDQALLGLEQAMQIADDDAEGFGHIVRMEAAQALERSPHPKAIPFLLSHWNDADDNVRLEVVHALAKAKPADAIPKLKQMAQDKSQMVAGEASLVLRQLSEKMASQ